MAKLFEFEQVIPFDLPTQQREGIGFFYKGQKFILHTDLDINETALHRLTWSQLTVILLTICFLVGMFLIDWHLTLVLIFSILVFLYFLDLVFNSFLIFNSLLSSNEIKVLESEIVSQESLGWPSYSIFCPLYKEASVLPQFISAISNLDYPKERLQVFLLLEEDDLETQNKLKECRLPPYFFPLIVPNSLPKTKPKACNFGLQKSNGKYCVIYDAEDVPEPLQLKKAVTAFLKASPETICIQAKLNFYNPRQNFLTKLFTAEYSLWFDLILVGLQSLNAPIPLGGTSNHFKAKELKELKGWDPFNVTEDCDLGIRLSKRGFKTGIFDSTTYEEANSEKLNWYRQRTRWIKGYIQTYFVHMRDPKRFFRDNWKNFIIFQLVVGGKVLSLFINPLMWLITFVYFWQRARWGLFIESFFPSIILYLGIVSLVFGNFLYFYNYLIGNSKRGYYDLNRYVFLIPVYWLSMSLAALGALYGLLTSPHHWAKTSHGLHLPNQHLAPSGWHYAGIFPMPIKSYAT